MRFGLFFFFSIIFFSYSERVIEKFPNGKVKIAYTLNKEGKKHGTYSEFFENGKPKIRCSYNNGILFGNYASYHDNGRPHKSIVYRDGKINGTYLERNDRGLILKDSIYTDNILIYPKGKNLLKSQLRSINSSKPNRKDTKFTSSKYAKAVNLLNSYRAIVGIDFDVKLKDEYCETAQAGAELCAKIGKLDHTPKNPGLPEDKYRKGYEGTSKSNLSMGRSMEATPMAYMDDSDKSNISRVGHRRWCINPAMQYTGFGAKGKFSAMYAFDQSRQTIPDYDYIAFPTRGFHPTKYFASHYAWSISLNPNKYSAPSKSVKVNIYPLGRTGRLPFDTKGKEPLELNYFNVDGGGFGIKYCIIFRPKEIKISGKYWVEIKGVKDNSGKEVTIGYLVDFVSI